MANTLTDDIGMLQFNLDPTERKDYQDQKIVVNKKMSDILKRAKENAKPKTCFICHKPCSSFCNSHSVPQFCLKQIAKDGKLYPSAWNSGLPIYDKELGVKKAGTFQIICNDCDSKVFQEYETPEIYSSPPSGKVLAQICLKNYLQMISKRKQEIELYKLGAEQFPTHFLSALHNIEIAELDLHEYELGFERAYKASNRNHTDWYYLCYFQKLDYVVPFSFQGQIVLVCGLDGEVINDIYNMSPNYRLEEIHIAVFPLKIGSVVMIITDSRRARYRKFYRQLKRLPLEDQLAIINYIIFSYSENVFISKDLDEKVLTDSAFQKMCYTTNIAVASTPINGQALDAALNSFDLSKRHTVPNLLSKKYALIGDRQLSP